jgi:hypothetical protein
MSAAAATRDTIWPGRPGQHLAITRQRCTAGAGCSAWASGWARCSSCPAVVAACGDHGGAPAVAGLRARHCGARR